MELLWWPGSRANIYLAKAPSLKSDTGHLLFLRKDIKNSMSLRVVKDT